MNKTIRLYNLIEFCNNNRNFKLKDVMEEFKISKSTALRDIKDIQELGCLYTVMEERMEDIKLLERLISQELI